MRWARGVAPLAGYALAAHAVIRSLSTRVSVVFFRAFHAHDLVVYRFSAILVAVTRSSSLLLADYSSLASSLVALTAARSRLFVPRAGVLMSLCLILSFSRVIEARIAPWLCAPLGARCLPGGVVPSLRGLRLLPPAGGSMCKSCGPRPSSPGGAHWLRLRRLCWSLLLALSGAF